MLFVIFLFDVGWEVCVCLWCIGLDFDSFEVCGEVLIRCFFFNIFVK